MKKYEISNDWHRIYEENKVENELNKILTIETDGEKIKKITN